MSVRIAMWSGPRNISTAMMRSFSSRADCAVTDEPFYGAYLKLTGEPHAMADDIIADMNCDWQSVSATMRGAIPGGKPVWYQKHMSHHMEGPVGIDDFPDHVHIFLVRDPDLMVASYRQKNELKSADQLGFARLLEYHDRISDRLGHAAPWSIATGCSSIRKKDCARYARQSASNGIQQCSVGPEGRTRPMAYGRRTGTMPYGTAAVLARPPSLPNWVRANRRSPISAAHIMKRFAAIASDA